MRGQLCLTGAGRCTVALWLPASMPLPSLGLRLPAQIVRAQAAERELLIAALRSLPPRQREVLVLRYYADLDVGEVARILRIGPSTVRSATARGLAGLARVIEGKGR